MTAQQPRAAADRPWQVIRQDDNGNRYLVGRHATRAEAEQTVARLEAGGHKQLYWVEPEPDASSSPSPSP